MPYYNCCVSGCTNNFRNVGKLPRCHIRHIVYFCPSKQATRPSPLLDWEMANWRFTKKPRHSSRVRCPGPCAKQVHHKREDILLLNKYQG